MKKIIILLALVFLIAGCNNTPSINGDNLQTIEPSVSNVYVDEGISPNIISVEGNFFVIYVKNGDIYSKKFYNDLRSVGESVRLTKNGNIKDVEAVFDKEFYVDMSYSDNEGSYKATYSIDWGETKKEKSSEKLSQTTSVNGISVYEDSGMIYLK